FQWMRPPPRSNLFPYTTLFRSAETSRLFHPEAERHGYPFLLAVDPGLEHRVHHRAGVTAATGFFAGGVTFDGNGDRDLGILHRRSEEHTSELQSRENLVCRLLL